MLLVVLPWFKSLTPNNSQAFPHSMPVWSYRRFDGFKAYIPDTVLNDLPVLCVSIPATTPNSSWFGIWRNWSHGQGCLDRMSRAKT